jgi:hypothetical protein
VICTVLVLLSLWGIIWYETSSLLKDDIGGLLLLSICLLAGGIFSVQFLMIVRSTGWLKSLQKNRTPKNVPSNEEEELQRFWLDSWQRERSRYSGK